MLAEIKLFGGLTCLNEGLEFYGKSKFSLEIQEGVSLKEIHQLLQLNNKNLVSIVNGSAQSPEFIIRQDCTISVFPPMGDRRYNPFNKI